MPTEVIRIDPVRPDAAALARAAGVLASGGLVAFPTETFYGLGAAALNADAVRRVFVLKGRPVRNPLLVIVDGIAMAETIADIPERARPLIARHWPGPLTLVCRARPVVPEEIGAGTGTVGVRWSPHPIARGLAAALGAPVTAPSANPTGAPPATSAAAVLRDFGDALEMVLDGGETAGGEPSTVIDVTVEPPRVIRAGAIRP
ncbi:MAG: threonylcarbamoyl-AMP synthase [Candidatus Rokubacteria bacterium]|nr:threonylcarbamoyl-AMP synthase [Candidatus Rokubacteria bacterium]